MNECRPWKRTSLKGNESSKQQRFRRYSWGVARQQWPLELFWVEDDFPLLLGGGHTIHDKNSDKKKRKQNQVSKNKVTAKSMKWSHHLGKEHNFSKLITQKNKMETQHKPFKEEVPILSTIIFRLPLVTEKVDLVFSRAPQCKILKKKYTEDFLAPQDFPPPKPRIWSQQMSCPSSRWLAFEDHSLLRSAPVEMSKQNPACFEILPKKKLTCPLKSVVLGRRYTLLSFWNGTLK